MAELQKKVVLMTLCLVCEPSRVLLGMKKRGFGAGRWNGFGGKVERGEKLEDAARRETKEEAGITVTDLDEVGVLQFEFAASRGEIIEMHIFRAFEYSGEPTESDEMVPKWFRFDEIPLGEMWPDDKYWFPLFLSGKNFKGRFLFGEGDRVLKHELKEVSGTD